MDSLVSTTWLAEHLGAGGLAVLDASLHLPAEGRDPAAEYAAAHIPGARFMALASLTDPASQVPAALPSPDQLASRLAQLGVTPDMRIVIYDDSTVKTAARGWFMLKAHGLDKVAVLDGGLAKWRREKRPLESGNPPVAADIPSRAKLPPARGVATKADMLANLSSAAEQVLDARGAARVFGSGIDPVHGGQNGRIPGSLNVPFTKVFADDGTYKSPDELRAIFKAEGADMAAPFVTTCGSGITASALLLALHLAGNTDVRLYDGSWQEWEADPETPKHQGPA